jgi:NitT/TauT family transport system substrate-binding protein
MNRRWIFQIGLLVLSLLATVSCDRREGAAKSAPKEVRLGYFANMTHAQAVLGVASGEYQNAVAPAQLTTRIFNAGPSLIEALLAGEIDVAYIGPGPVLNGQARTHGQGLRVIAGATDNGTVIVARDGSGIRTLEDLKGRKLATPQHGNTQDIAARHYLKDVLHQSDLENVIPVSNAEQAGMMSRGEIDAAWAAEPWGSFLVAQDGAHVIAEEKNLWPHKRFTLAVMVTTPDFLSEHPDIIAKLLKAHVQWTRRLQENPTQYIPQLDAALFSLTGKKLPKGVVAAGFGRVQFSDEPLQETFESLSDWSTELEFLPGKVDLSGLFDTTILRKIQREASSTQPRKEGADASRRASNG